MRFKAPRIASMLLAFIAAAWLPLASRAKDEKLKPEELIAKHLESIGSADKRSAVKSRTTAGNTQVVFRVGGSGILNGKGNLLSEPNSVRLGLAYNAVEYPGEQIAFDGNKVSVGQVSPGVRSPLSNFLLENDVLLREGLLFGSLSSSWTLLDVAGKQPKLTSNGIKKIDGRQLYELKYEPRRRGNIQQLWLYFDPETFRHVRSEYKMERSTTRVNRITDSAELARYTIVEQFEDFKQVDGLTLPYSYKLDFSIDAPDGGILTGWSYLVEKISHNDPLDRRLFAVQ